MADNELQVRLLHAAKTQDQWKAVTSYPKKGEVCLEAINTSGATAFKIKIGDGTRPYCRNTGTPESPVWDFISENVLPYFGSVIETSGTANVVSISDYTVIIDGSSVTKKKLSFYSLRLSAKTEGGSTTLTPTIASTPYLEMIEGEGIDFTTDETGTIKEFYINIEPTSAAPDVNLAFGDNFTVVTPDSNNRATKRTKYSLPTLPNGNATTTDTTSSAKIITSVSETSGVISSTEKTLVEGNKIDITIPTTGTSTGDIIISHENIDTTATDVASSITTDSSSTVDEKELNIITGIKVDAQGHITHIDKDKSTNLIAADIKAPVEKTDDSMWTYRTTAGTTTIVGKDVAEVEELKGKTLKWQQLVSPSYNSPNIGQEFNGITVDYDSATQKYRVHGTSTGYDRSIIRVSIQGIAGHYYAFVTSDKFGGSGNQALYCDFGTGGGGALYQNSIKQIMANNAFGVYCIVPSGLTVDFEFYINIFDLTEMGLDSITSVAEFKALYPLDYYDYTATPVLKNNAASGIVTTGLNQWDEEWELKNGYVSSKNNIPVLPNTDYFFKVGDFNTQMLRINAYDASGSNLGYIGYGMNASGWGIPNHIVTTPENAAYISFAVYTSYGTTYNHDICINLSWSGYRNGEYEPYEKHTLYFNGENGSLATVTGKKLVSGVPTGESVTIFPDGMKSAGSVYDFGKADSDGYIRKVTKRIGSVDLGELTWDTGGGTSVSGGRRFRVQNFDAKVIGNNNTPNMMCTRYNAVTNNATYGGTTGVSTNGTALYLYDSDFITYDGTQLKTAVTGVKLIYELASPEEYVLDTPIPARYLVNDYGTEMLLPQGVDTTTNVPYTVPFSGIIKYQSNFKDAVLDTIDKVNNYKNPVKSKDNVDQTTGKVAVYDSTSTVKSSTFTISNDTISSTGTDNETTVPTVDAVVDYIADELDDNITVTNVTTTDTGTSGLEVTTSSKTKDVHHKTVTQSNTEVTTPEVVKNVVTGVTVDNYGHITGKEVISSDKLIAADIKAPVKQTDNTTWNHRITGGDISIGEDTAKIPVLKGNTIVWNQLVQNGNFTSTSNWTTGTGATFSVTNNIATIKRGDSDNRPIYQNINIISGHKYFISAIVQSDDTAKKTISLGGIDIAETNETTTRQRISGITIGATNDVYRLGIRDKATENFADFTVENVILIDLTKLFGSDVDIVSALSLASVAEITTDKAVQAFERLFPSDYYEYNEGELVSLDVEGVKSTGFNQWDEQYTSGNGSNGDIDYNQHFHLVSINFIPIIPGQTYYFKSITDNLTIYGYDSNKQKVANFSLITLQNTTYTIPNGVYYIKFQRGGSDFSYNNDICINISDSSRNGIYIPYKEETLDLSWIKDIKDSNDNQLFPYGLCSAGSVYDEVQENKVIKRVGCVDLGTLTYTRSEFSGTYAFLKEFSLMASGGQKTTVKYTAADQGYVAGMPDKTYTSGPASGQFIAIRDDDYSTASDFKTAMNGVMLYYELATPIEVDIDPAKNMSYLVYDLGTETQLPINPPTTTPITAPFVGTFEYKSNFKDTVIDLINKVNNAVNPVKGINNTDQTVGKIAVYDSERTTHSSNYSASNATIVEGATGNDIILPAVETIINYVNSKLSSALTYKGTVAQWSDLPTSGQNTGDMYIASTTFTEQSVTYNAGDFFIWNGSSWDIVSGTTSVDDKDISLTMNGTRVTVATVDGNDIHITTPNLNASSPSSSSGTGVDFIDTISQTNGLVSATSKRVRSASTSQDGIVTLSSGIESTSSENNKIPTAYDTLTNLNNRDVDSGTITNDIATLSKRMLDEDSTSPTYESWINKTFYPTTKFNAIDDFSTAFGTNYPDLNTIEGLSTTGFLKRTGSNTWELTDDTGKMTWLKAITSGTDYSYAPLSDSSSNDTEVGSYIHNYPGVTSIDLATLNNENKGFRVDVPLLTSDSAEIHKVLVGNKTIGVTSLPNWRQLSVEDLVGLTNLGTSTGYLKRSLNGAYYEWTIDTPVTTVYNFTVKNSGDTVNEFDPDSAASYVDISMTHSDGTETTQSTTSGAGLKMTNGTNTYYQKVSTSALINDSVDILILNGNFS